METRPLGPNTRSDMIGNLTPGENYNFTIIVLSYDEYSEAVSVTQRISKSCRVSLVNFCYIIESFISYFSSSRQCQLTSFDIPGACLMKLNLVVRISSEINIIYICVQYEYHVSMLANSCHKIFVEINLGKSERREGIKRNVCKWWVFIVAGWRSSRNRWWFWF